VATPIARLMVELGLDPKGFTKGLAEADNQLGKTESRLASWGKNLTSAGKSLTAGVTLPLVAAGGVAIKWASDLNEASSAVATVFGADAEKVAGAQGSVAKSLGLSREEALSYASALGALYKSVGLTTSASADMSNEVTQAAADLGSFFNVPIGQVLDDIKSGLVGEFEPLRKYGILLSAAAVEQKALAMTGKTSAKELTEQEKVLARQELIMSQLGAAQGDFARTSDGLANSTRILSAQFKDAGAQLGTQLLPYATQLVGWASDMITKFQGLSPEMQKIILVVGGIAAAIGPLLIVLGTMASGIAAIGSIIAIVTPIIAGLGTVLAVLLSPIGLIVVAVAGLYLAWHYNLFGIRDITAEVVDWLIEKFNQLVAWFTDGGLDAALQTLRRWALDLIHYGKVAIKYYVLWPYYLGKALYGPVKEQLLKLAALFIELPGKITAPFNGLFDAFFNIGYNIISGLISGIAALWDQFAGWVDSIIGKVGEVAEKLDIFSPSRVTMEWGEQIVRGLSKGIEGAMPMLDRAVGGMTGAVTGADASLALAPATARAIAGGGGASGGNLATTNNFAAGAIVVYESQNAEATAKEIMRRIRYMEAGAA
jgi:phage-related minor tail protein